MQSNIEELLNLINQMKALLEDPQPGFFTWHDFYNKTRTKILNFWGFFESDEEPNPLKEQVLSSLETKMGERELKQLLRVLNHRIESIDAAYNAIIETLTGDALNKRMDYLSGKSSAYHDVKGIVEDMLRQE